MGFDQTFLEILARLALACAFGALVGIEREAQKKTAGLRTNMMVSLGAATFTLIAATLIGGGGTADPTRIVTGVATGIGFLGAGSIIQSGRNVEGVTTAAGIWLVGGIGAACGVGAVALAAVATALGVVILRLGGWVEGKGRKKASTQETP
jgi:putative Mg2+ transporter-C (MgtC) family protein